MRTMVTVVLVVGVLFASVWAWNEWKATGGTFALPEDLGGGAIRGAVDGFGNAICKAWGC